MLILTCVFIVHGNETQDVLVVQHASSVDGPFSLPRLLVNGGEYLDSNVLGLPLAKEHLAIATLAYALHKLDLTGNRPVL